MEDATAGTGILASFVVEAGGNLDVDVSITSPDGALIAHSTPGASDETVRAKAPVDGKYTYGCIPVGPITNHILMCSWSVCSQTWHNASTRRELSNELLSEKKRVKN
jgi:hypothetical protein